MWKTIWIVSRFLLLKTRAIAQRDMGHVVFCCFDVSLADAANAACRTPLSLTAHLGSMSVTVGGANSGAAPIARNTLPFSWGQIVHTSQEEPTSPLTRADAVVLNNH